eukprot:TRINITY_DN1522_c9_g1_i1.p1 TRINITY_DN1522_c9_g1~~TRINITY_DN1522_c9_g1_i1.p1  ORF type:complete len:285 (+),score=39.03 TRINITY_DN1522_c9_g1_i1:70-924(+)
MNGESTTRKGDRFLNPENVTLHCTDFEYEDHAEDMSKVIQFSGIYEGDSGKDAEENEKRWEKHYTQSGSHFPIKNYLVKAFPELLTGKDEKNVLECGCGTGSAILPVVNIRKNDHFYAFDISKTAVARLQTNPIFADHFAFVWDITLPLAVKLPKFDHILLIFVLSAVHPTIQQRVLQVLSDLLESGGTILFRDYGMYDDSQMRFHRKHIQSGKSIQKTSEDKMTYLRGDGTHSYFYTTDEVSSMASKCGLSVISCDYHCNELNNRKDGTRMRKVFVNAVLQKP